MVPMLCGISSLSDNTLDRFSFKTQAGNPLRYQNNCARKAHHVSEHSTERRMEPHRTFNAVCNLEYLRTCTDVLLCQMCINAVVPIYVASHRHRCFTTDFTARTGPPGPRGFITFTKLDYDHGIDAIITLQPVTARITEEIFRGIITAQSSRKLAAAVVKPSARPPAKAAPRKAPLAVRRIMEAEPLAKPNRACRYAAVSDTVSTCGAMAF